MRAEVTTTTSKPEGAQRARGSVKKDEGLCLCLCCIYGGCLAALPLLAFLTHLAMRA